MQPHYRGDVGMFPIHVDAICINCKEPLKKKHGINPNRPGEPPTVMGWMLGGTGPRCVWCHREAWCDAEFWKRQGHSEYTSRRYDVEWDFRPKESPR
jgi:hypothetical protein